VRADVDDRSIVSLELALELIELLREFRVGCEHLAQRHKSANDENTHFDGSRAA
jgi:hypothetical protein